MSRRLLLSLSIALAVMAGCASQAKLLNDNQDPAVQTALGRARFEMNCPAATATVLSREVVQPAMQGPWINGIQRAEYTIGVSGCGLRKTYIVICPEGGSGCYAAGPGAFHRDFLETPSR
jgi:hypothetical protein